MPEKLESLRNYVIRLKNELDKYIFQEPQVHAAQS